MEKKITRRKTKRYAARLKAAAVFDTTDARPVLHTHTEDLSIDGAAICSEYADLTGSYITLLLDMPSPRAGEPGRIVNLRARVVSTAHTTGTAAFRHGLNFIRNDENIRELLPVLALEVARARPSALAAPATYVEPLPRSPAKSRLAKLKALAQAKLAQEKSPIAQESPNLAVGDALRRAHEFLKDLAAQLDILKPAYRRGNYSIAGVPEFSGLVWMDSRMYFNTREIGRSQKVWNSVSLHYRLSGNRQLEVARDYPANERLTRILTENRIEFSTHERKNDGGFVVGTTFNFQCEVAASLALAAIPGTGEINLRMVNVERFGTTTTLLAPESINDASLDELIAFVLGETSHMALLNREIPECQASGN